MSPLSAHTPLSPNSTWCSAWSGNGTTQGMAEGSGTSPIREPPMSIPGSSTQVTINPCTKTSGSLANAYAGHSRRADGSPKSATRPVARFLAPFRSASPFGLSPNCLGRSLESRALSTHLLTEVSTPTLRLGSLDAVVASIKDSGPNPTWDQ